jgi:hypothetical protein
MVTCALLPFTGRRDRRALPGIQILELASFNPPFSVEIFSVSVSFCFQTENMSGLICPDFPIKKELV